MFDFDLVISKKSREDKLILKLPLFYYLIFAIVTIILFISIVTYGYSIISIIFFIISASALSMRESWDFDKNRNSVIYSFGFGIFGKSDEIKFSDIELVEFIEFTKGVMGAVKKSNKNIFSKNFNSIKIHLTNGKDYTVITASARKYELIKHILDSIAEISKAKIER